jgi:hypothetical protein
MRDNFSISVFSIIVNSLISYYTVKEDFRPSRKLKIVRLSFDRRISRIDIFIRNTFNDVNIFNCGGRKRRICRLENM